MRHWYNGDTTGQHENYGIMLCYHDPDIADYNSVYSADCTDANSRPSLTISYTPLSNTYELDIGSTMHLFVTGVSSGVTWTSSNTSVATIDSNGVLTAAQVGTATITASGGDEVYRIIQVCVTIADGVYRIVNTAGLNLATSGSIAENTLAKMRSYSGSGFEKLCQLWKIKHLGNGYYSIRPMHKLDMALHAGGTMGSSVDIVSIGTSDEQGDVPSLCRWGISPTSDGNSYFINHVGTGSLAMTMDGPNPSVDMGVITDISSETQGYFKWMLQPIGETTGGAILYSTSTQTVVINPSRHMETGEVKTLSDLGLSVNAYSNTIIDQNPCWQSDNPLIARVDSETGVVTAVSTGTATITGSVYRAGQYHYVSFGVCVGYPELFNELIDLGCIRYTQCDETDDGLFLMTASLSDVLEAKAVSHLVVNEEGTKTWEVSQYYDDWYIYAVNSDSSVAYGLYKMREIENDDYDGNDPGVTISFISFDKAKLIQCLNSPIAAHQYTLYSSISKVTGPGAEEHDDRLAKYFKETASEGAYLIAEIYVLLIASMGQNGTIDLSANCISALDQSDVRIYKALDRINTDAGYEIYIEGSSTLSISNINNMSIPEKQAILCCFTGNETFNSFAAEVLFHADAIYNWRTNVTILENEWYGAAIRADMSVGEEYESGNYDDYYDLSSDLVQEQIDEHGEY